MKKMKNSNKNLPLIQKTYPEVLPLGSNPCEHPSTVTPNSGGVNFCPTKSSSPDKNSIKEPLLLSTGPFTFLSSGLFFEKSVEEAEFVGNFVSNSQGKLRSISSAIVAISLSFSNITKECSNFLIFITFSSSAVEEISSKSMKFSSISMRSRSSGLEGFLEKKLSSLKKSG